MYRDTLVYEAFLILDYGSIVEKHSYRCAKMAQPIPKKKERKEKQISWEPSLSSPEEVDFRSLCCTTDIHLVDKAFLNFLGAQSPECACRQTHLHVHSIISCSVYATPHADVEACKTSILISPSACLP